MKQLTDIVRENIFGSKTIKESIFDIDDETITNKHESFRNNIVVSNHNQKKYDSINFNTETIKQFIDMICDDYLNDTTDFDMNEIAWDLMCVIFQPVRKKDCWYIQVLKKSGPNWKNYVNGNKQVGFIYFSSPIKEFVWETDNLGICKKFQKWINKEINRINHKKENYEKFKELCN